MEPLQFEKPCMIYVELEVESFFCVIADTVDEDNEGKVLEFRKSGELVARCIKEKVTDWSTHKI